MLLASAQQDEMEDLQWTLVSRKRAAAGVLLTTSLDVLATKDVATTAQVQLRDQAVLGVDAI